MKKFKHGGDIYTMAKKLQCRPEEIIDFSANINTVVPTVALPLSETLIERYGDPHYRDLKKSIAKKYALKKSQITLFNGASSAIFELFRVLSPKHTYLYVPLYGEYVKASEHFSQNTHTINRLKREMPLPKKGATVVFVNPSTPDGRYYDLEDLFALWKQKKCTIIIDESFLEFTNKPSLKAEIKAYKKLYIIHSFTKFYACAGLRVGAIFTHKKNSAQFLQPAWPLSSFDTAYLTRLLEVPYHQTQSLLKQQTLHKILYTILKESALFTKIYNSDANFILAHSKHAKKIYKTLYAQKILVRNCDNFQGLSKNHLRFAVKSKQDLQLLQKALNALT